MLIWYGLILSSDVSSTSKTVSKLLMYLLYCRHAEITGDNDNSDVDRLWIDCGQTGQVRNEAGTPGTRTAMLDGASSLLPKPSSKPYR